MIKLVDRQMIRGFFKAYFVCLISLLCLYVVVDLFTNLDDFSGGGFTSVAKKIALYYSCQITTIFDRLCEAIILLAAMFTVAWMQRSNEQVPLLAAGVSTQRIVFPVLVCACSMISLTVINQELVIPRVADRLSNDKGDPEGKRDFKVNAAWDRNGMIQIAGKTASRDGMIVQQFDVTIKEDLAGRLIHLSASEARFIPKGPRHGTWEMIGTNPPEEDTWDPNVLERVDKGRYLLHTRDVNFDTLTRKQRWFSHASTVDLYEQLQKSEAVPQTNIAVLFHMRLTRPLLGVLLVLMGVSIILRDQNRNVILSAGGCLILCGLFFAVIFSCKMLGDKNIIGPILAAWLPVILFGPFAFVLFDAVHT